MIQTLLDDDIERFYSDASPADYFAWLRRYGFRGYNDWSAAELQQEITDRQLDPVAE